MKPLFASSAILVAATAAGILLPTTVSVAGTPEPFIGKWCALGNRIVSSLKFDETRIVNAGYYDRSTVAFVTFERVPNPIPENAAETVYLLKFDGMKVAGHTEHLAVTTGEMLVLRATEGTAGAIFRRCD